MLFGVLPRYCILLFPVRKLRHPSVIQANPCPRETKQRTLEEIASAFGDKVVLVSDREIVDEQAILEGKAGFGHLESTSAPVKETP